MRFLCKYLKEEDKIAISQSDLSVYSDEVTCAHQIAETSVTNNSVARLPSLELEIELALKDKYGTFHRKTTVYSYTITYNHYQIPRKALD